MASQRSRYEHCVTSKKLSRRCATNAFRPAILIIFGEPWSGTPPLGQRPEAKWVEPSGFRCLQERRLRTLHPDGTPRFLQTAKLLVQKSNQQHGARTRGTQKKRNDVIFRMKPRNLLLTQN